MVVVTSERATFFQRFAATMVDFVLLGFANYLIGLVLEPTAAFFVSLAIGVAYYGNLEGGPTGQTIGKRVLAIKVVRSSTGGELGFATVLRYFAHYVSAIPFLLGFFWMLWDPEKQTWHDKIAGTYVVPATP